ncbi:hypothetical protein ACH4E8_06470 [Streptomyces sp. NPDC017979]|uniref:hypothetical protein n=1 Tax=Streptomyces sp. NPDC017979 TaxID=3365024 RepID=UPI00378F616E
MAQTPGWVAAGLVTLCALGWLADRALLSMEARGWIYWRRKGLSSMGANLLQDTSPAAQALKRAMQDERSLKNVRVAEEPPQRVDLDAGVVRVRRTEDDRG